MTALPRPRSSIARDLAFCLALALLCGIAFHHVFSCDFIPFDDNIEIFGNPQIHNLSLSNLQWMFTNTSLTQRYTPLSWIAWTLIYKAFGLRPAAFHGLAFFVQLANTLILFFLFRNLLRRTTIAASLNRVSLAAALGAALWGIHPLRVEVVSWATQVRFAEATLFSLLSLLAYLCAADDAPEKIHRSVFFWLSVVAYTTSIFFYPIAIGVALLLPLLDLYLLRRPRAASERRSLLAFTLEKIPFLLPALFIGLFTLHGRFTDSKVFQAAATTAEFGIPHRVMQAAYIFIYYLWKPFDILHISAVYTQLYTFNPFAPVFLASLAAFVLLTILAIRFRNTHPYLFLLWCAHILFIFPVGGYFEHPHYPSDRYGYLEGILLPLLLVALGLRILPTVASKLRVLLPIVAAALIVICTMLSAAYAHAWTNGESFFLSILATLGNDPYRFDIQTRLGTYYAEHQDYRQALFCFDQVIPRAPSYARPFYFKGMTLLKLAEIGETQHQPPSTLVPLYGQAETLLDQAATLAPSAANFIGAGDAYFEAKDFSNAQARYEAALSLDPHNPALPAKIAQCSAHSHP